MARIRTFIGVGLDKSILGRLISLQEQLASTGADAKWVEPENLHVTLLFLGEVGDRDVVDVCRTISTSCKDIPAFGMTVEGVGCFPDASRPRTLWVGLGEGGQEMRDLHNDLEQALFDLGCYRKEGRRYTPHITLGRMKSDAANAEITSMLTKQAAWKGGPMHVSEVLVMSSQLTSKGPIYSVLSRGKLLGGGE
jgi:RNA 2',3'-cyclic 3'-phosphodiesterase